MFKSILPSRRLPSTDFTMVTSLSDVSNTAKENYPNLGIGQQPLNRNMKDVLHYSKIGASVHERKKKTDNKNKDQFIPSILSEAETDSAFDQLLVCILMVDVKAVSSHN